MKYSIVEKVDWIDDTLFQPILRYATALFATKLNKVAEDVELIKYNSTKEQISFLVTNGKEHSWLGEGYYDRGTQTFHINIYKSDNYNILGL